MMEDENRKSSQETYGKSTETQRDRIKLWGLRTASSLPIINTSYEMTLLNYPLANPPSHFQAFSER